MCTKEPRGNAMTTAEKIKYLRTSFGMTQEMLASLSGINVATIKKYEHGIRNPKPDQLLKIANALGVSIYAFMDFEISTVSDVMALLMKMDEQVDVNFEYEKEEDGSINAKSIRLSFDDPYIYESIANYIRVRDLLASAEDAYNKKPSGSRTDEDKKAIAEIRIKMDKAKLQILKSTKIVKKNVKGTWVRNIFAGL
jgi:transcriptional regulator with XRE-family HTH domain